MRLPALLGALLLVSCTTAGPSVRTVAFITSSTLGLDIEAGQGGEQGVRLGYQRQEFLSMPTLKAPGAAGGEPGIVDEALPVLAIFSMDTGKLVSTDLTVLKVRQVFATGLAAVAPGAPEAVAKAFVALAGGELMTEEALDLVDPVLQRVNALWPTQEAAITGIVSRALAQEKELTPETFGAIAAQHLEGDDLDARLESVEGQPPKVIATSLIELAGEMGKTAELQRILSELAELAGG